jgi:lambda family phage portal protein
VTILSTIRRLFTAAGPASSTWAGTQRHPNTEPSGRRRWEAADTNRLNTAHWSLTNDSPINVHLEQRLPTLRQRSAYEAANNPLIEGVICTHAADCVARGGPSLQIQTEKTDYANALEAAWRSWWASPDASGRLTGPQLLRAWIRSLWINGEFLGQIVTGQGIDPGGPTMRVLDLNPNRLQTPADQYGSHDIALGVQTNAHGRPTRYWLTDPQRQGASTYLTGKYLPVPPSDILHGFATQEAGQVRGTPWLAPALEAIAALRDYDDQVLDAARQAADQAVFWYSDHIEAPFLSVNESTEIERRTQSTGPPGWKPAMLNPSQPSTTYTDYRRERMADIGRAVSMPLMLVRLTAENHNYSSARMDVQLYARGLGVLQELLEAVALNRLAAELARELRVMRQLPDPPADARTIWLWPRPPFVDPQKEAMAERIELENGTTAYTEALARRNLSLEEMVRMRQKEQAALAAAGLPPLPRPRTGPPPLPAAAKPANGKPANGKPTTPPKRAAWPSH